LLFFWQIKKNAVIFVKLKLQIMTLTANRQPPTANRQPPTANRQPPTANRP
jgi:hypothetical protein